MNQCGMTVALACYLGLAASNATAGIINVGDFIVTERVAGGGALVRVDRSTGSQSIISSGGSLIAPNGLVLAGEYAYVSNLGDSSTASSVIRVDLRTGVQSTVSSGGHLLNPFGLAISSSGDLLVADFGAAGISSTTADGRLVRINALTGAQSLVSSGGNLVNPTDVAISGAGDLFVTEARRGIPTGGAILKVDASSGAQSIVTGALPLVDPVALALDGSGNAFVAEENSHGGFGSLLRVDLSTGAITTIASGLPFGDPRAIAIEADGNIILGDGGFNGIRGNAAIYRIDPLTGVRTVLTHGGLLNTPTGIEIATEAITAQPVPEPSSLTMLFAGGAGLIVLARRRRAERA